MPGSTQVKSILNKTKRRDPWFLDDYTVNPYSGCSFNCLFCYIRGSKYGVNMEDKLLIKANAVELLDRQLALRAKKKQYGIIVMSSATDPYLHFEETERLTRQMLEVILKHRFPVHIITRSALVLRDLDLIHEIDKQAILPDDLQNRLSRKAFITFSFSTLDDDVAGKFEPGALPPTQRLKVMEQCIKRGLNSGVSMMPLLPYISDTSDSLKLMFDAFANVGAHYLLPATLTLFGNGPSDSKTLVLRGVAKHYPHLLDKYQKFFAAKNEMPNFYRSAFKQKMAELLAHYKLKDSII